MLRQRPLSIVKKSEPKYFQPETVFKIADCLERKPLKWKFFTHLLLLTGTRRGELAKLEWNRIDLKTALLDVGKELLYTPDVGIYADVILDRKNS